MSGFAPRRLGRSPRDTARTRRVAQRLANLQIGVDGQSLIIDTDGNIAVNPAAPVQVGPAGITIQLRDATLSIDAGGLGVQLKDGGGLLSDAEGLYIDPEALPESDEPGPSTECCELLVSDTHSDPPVMLTNEPQDDFLFGVPA